MTIKLYELLGDEDRRYSQFSWRARMALKHKGLDFQIIPVLLTDKETIAFSGGTTVPVLVDGDTVMRDSWEIAGYLEDSYADRPSLFGGEIGRGTTRMIQAWTDRALNIALGSMVARDVLDAAHPDDRAYFRESMEKMYKRTLEEVQAGREDRVKGLYRTLDPVRQVLRAGQAFMSGDAPAYADYVVFSPLQWARITSPFKLLEADDPVYAWRERMLDLYDGHARNVTAFDVAA